MPREFGTMLGARTPTDAKLRRAALACCRMLACALSIAVAGPSFAGDLEAGIRALEAKSYSAALREFVPLSEKSNNDAAFWLGVMHYGGLGVPVDRDLATKWFRRAADGGHAKAQFNLGVILSSGKRTADIPSEARDWLRKAAAQGLSEAAVLLADMLDQGTGIPQEIAEALQWYRAAAENGNREAQYQLGRMYGTGRGTPEDVVQAYRWFDVAAGGGHEMARTKRDAIARIMTANQITEARRMAGQQTQN